MTASDFTTQDALTSQPVRLVVRGTKNSTFFNSKYFMTEINLIILLDLLQVVN